MYINETTTEPVSGKVAYLIFKLSTSGVNLVKITKDINKLKEFDNNPYYVIYRAIYRNKLVLINRKSGMRVRDLVENIVKSLSMNAFK